MNFYSTTFCFTLWLSISAILFLEASAMKRQVDDTDFDPENIQPDGRPNGSGLSNGGGPKINDGLQRAALVSSPAQENGNLFNQVTNGLQGMMNGGGNGLASGGITEARQASHIGAKSLSHLPGKAAETSSNTLVGSEEKNSGEHGALEPVKSLADFAKLILNPLELTKQISAHFKLPLEKLIEKIGQGYVFGLEAMLQPVLACFKIVEKVFQPDSCRLKFACKMSSHLHFIEEKMPLKFPSHLLDSSLHLKAMGDGYAGKDCETIYSDCGGEPKLKKPFEELKEIQGTKGSAVGARGLAHPVGVEVNVSARSGNKQVTSNAVAGKTAQ